MARRKQLSGLTSNVNSLSDKCHQIVDNTFIYDLKNGLPWHKLGKEIDESRRDSFEMIAEDCGANFEVYLKPLQVPDRKGNLLSVYNTDEKEVYNPKTGMYEIKKGNMVYSLLREVAGEPEDLVLSVGMTENWKPLQPMDSIEIFFKIFKGIKGATLDTAGVLNSGRVVFMSAYLSEGFRLPSGDTIRGNISLVNNLQYGSGIYLFTSATRPVCANTVRAALNNKNGVEISLNHNTKSETGFRKEIETVFEVSIDELRVFSEAAAFLESKQYSEEDCLEFLNIVFPNTSKKESKKGELSRNADSILEILSTGSIPGNSEFPKQRGSFYELVNAVTFFGDHRPDSSENVSKEKQALSSFMGKMATTKAKAFDTALMLASR